MKNFRILAFLLLGMTTILSCKEDSDNPEIEGTLHAAYAEFDTDHYTIQLDGDEEGPNVSGGHTSTTQPRDEAAYHYHIQKDLYLNQYCILFSGDYQGTPNGIQ